VIAFAPALRYCGLISSDARSFALVYGGTAKSSWQYEVVVGRVQGRTLKRKLDGPFLPSLSTASCERMRGTCLVVGERTPIDEPGLGEALLPATA
jgi:hypothetical protein